MVELGRKSKLVDKHCPLIETLDFNLYLLISFPFLYPYLPPKILLRARLNMYVPYC